MVRIFPTSPRMSGAAGARLGLLLGTLLSLIVALVPQAARAEGSSVAEGWDQKSARSTNTGGCNVVASPAYFGFSCGGKGGSSNRPPVSKLLPGPPYDETPCWHVPLSQVELDAVGKQNTDDLKWFWRYSVWTGISVADNVFEPRIETTLVPLTPQQERNRCKLTATLLSYLTNFASYSTVPRPIITSSPAAHPRVNSYVSFFDASGKDEVTVTDARAPGLRLVASLDYTTVYPYGYGKGHQFKCEGGGHRAKEGEEPQTDKAAEALNKKGGCWFKYDQASYDQYQRSDYKGYFPAKMETHWTVQLLDAGAPQLATPLDFDKPGVSQIQVTQVKAVVVR